MINASKKLAGAALALSLAAGGAHAQQVLFWSTQARPVEETQKMRDKVLKGFEGAIVYQVAEDGPWLTRLQAELQAGSGTIGLLGGLHGDFSTVGANLVDLSAVDVGAVKVNEAYKKLGMLGTGEQKYLPWMQATYLMAANKKALQYLPQGVDLNTITYDQLIEWSKNIAEKTGSPKFGFPAGPKGLKHRFFEGFLYPSYTGSMVTKFRSAEAETAWNKFRELWRYTNPNSTNYAPDMNKAKALIAYMLKPETQIATLSATNFFPVVDVKLPDDMPASVKAFGPAIATMTGAPDALPALLPMGLGDLGGKFNQVYTDSFERIVLGGEDVHGVLEQQAAALKALIDRAKAPCWAPDKPSQGACPVD